MKKKHVSKWQTFKTRFLTIWHSLPWLFHHRVILIPVIGGCQLRIEQRQEERVLLLDDADFLKTARVLHYEVPREFALSIGESIVIPKWAFDEVKRLITGKALKVAK